MKCDSCGYETKDTITLDVQMKRRSNNAMHCNGSVKVTKVFYISFRHRKETLEYKGKEDQTKKKQW